MNANIPAIVTLSVKYQSHVYTTYDVQLVGATPKAPYCLTSVLSISKRTHLGAPFRTISWGSKGQGNVVGSPVAIADLTRPVIESHNSAKPVGDGCQALDNLPDEC